ncbi:MAG: DNA cytosine methyltransferase, partial [Desulfofundulus sp.]
ELQPLAVLMENVPDILNYGGYNVAEEMCIVLDNMGYNCLYTLLNAVYYGVPEMRERMFLIGIAKELNINPTFPQPTHWAAVPAGYENARKVALRYIFRTDPSGSNYYVDPPRASTHLRPAVTVREAIGDLPKITEHLEGRLRRGIKKLDVFVPYPPEAHVSEYARLMREWPGFESAGGVWDHVIRFLPRDYPIFKRMKEGDQYPEAYRIALELFKERFQELAAAGKIVDVGSEDYKKLWKATVPPYDPNKFPNKWRKMEADLPARTLMAHLGKDSYSHIHYDSEQARTISVREAARLQSFPDGFRFEGTMNPAFRQIGNAVPPLMAQAIAAELIRTLSSVVFSASTEPEKNLAAAR